MKSKVSEKRKSAAAADCKECLSLTTESGDTIIVESRGIPLLSSPPETKT